MSSRCGRERRERLVRAYTCILQRARIEESKCGIRQDRCVFLRQQRAPQGSGRSHRKTQAGYRGHEGDPTGAAAPSRVLYICVQRLRPFTAAEAADPMRTRKRPASREREQNTAAADVLRRFNKNSSFFKKKKTTTRQPSNNKEKINQYKTNAAFRSLARTK